MADTQKPRAFVCYAHSDIAWRERLLGGQQHVPTTLGSMFLWTDARIDPGDRWRDEIHAALEMATVAVLLVSPRFFESAFIRDTELPRLIERQKRGELRIVWLPIEVDEALVRSSCTLDVTQAAFGYDRKLAASPDACRPGEIDTLRDLLAQALERAIDPIGAKVRQHVAPRYENLDRIGMSSLSCVYKARDRALDRDVAIKALRDPDQRDAFMKDVLQAIRTSEHPNFVNVYDVADGSGPAYCIVQHVDGQTLAQRIASCGALSCHAMLPIFTRIVAAIARAHAMGLGYGNIKPSNIILLDRDDEPFILPVGRERNLLRDRRRVEAIVDRLRDGAAEPADTEDLAYLVPDHFGALADAVEARRSDQYMLGLLAWQMACGRLPEAVHADRLAVQGRRAFDPLPAVTASSRLLYPQRLAEIVARMAALDPENRYEDLKGVLDKLRGLGDLHLLLARESYARCMATPNFDADFFQRFYAEFLKCEGARKLFEGFDDTRRQNQHRMLKQAVLLLLAYAQQGDEPGLGANLLSAVADKHPRPLPDAYFERFLEALLKVVTGPGGDPWCKKLPLREQVAAAWRKALEPGLKYMRGRLH